MLLSAKTKMMCFSGFNGSTFSHLGVLETSTVVSALLSQHLHGISLIGFPCWYE